MLFLTIVTAIMMMAFVVTICVLSIGELAQQIGWCLVPFYGPGDKAAVQGALITALSMGWLVSSGVLVGWIGEALLGGADEGLTLGAIAIDLLMAIWWIVTIHFSRARRKYREAHGIPETAWGWIRERLKGVR